MTIEGYGPYQIASKLKEEKILMPSAYLAQHGEGVNKNKTFKDVYDWGSSTICNLSLIHISNWELTADVLAPEESGPSTT